MTNGWPVPAALLALSAVPIAAGTLRLIELAGGPALIPPENRSGFAALLVVHIIGAAAYAVAEYLVHTRVHVAT